MTMIDSLRESARGLAGAVAERGYMLYYPVGAAIGACEGVTKATYEAVTTLPPVLLKDPALLVKGTKNNKKVDMNGFVEEPKRAMENGIKAAHETAHSAAAHAKKAHLPSDSKIAQMSNKPMAHVEAKG